MYSFQDSRIMQYNAELVKNIVMDIEKYPEFIPWCSKAIILSRNEKFFTAELFIKFHGFKESYVSKITNSRSENQYNIEAIAISGPFKLLHNIWRIKPINDVAQVDFSIDFTFKSKILDKVMGMLFSLATAKIIGAFEARAAKLSTTE